MSARARTLAGLVFAMVLVISTPESLFACPICFQVEQGPVTAGVRAAVLVLIGVTLAVLVGFVTFAVRVVRRGAALARTETRP